MVHYAPSPAGILLAVTDHSSQPVAPRPARQVLIWTLKIVVSVGLLYWLLSGVDTRQLWRATRDASLPWLAAALVCYLVMVLISAWRWGLLLDAQGTHIPFSTLTNSFLVATFFNNVLPSNIGGDVIRIQDTARRVGSRTVATTVVVLDRGIGLLGLIFIAAVGATMAAAHGTAFGPIGPGVLWAIFGIGVSATMFALLMPSGVGRLLEPLRAFHKEWVGERIERLIATLTRFRAQPVALASCLVGAILVQGALVFFYVATARALAIPISVAHLAILVPLSFIVQMAPISVNGFGVRETTFKLYFAQLGLSAEPAIGLSLTGAALVIVFSISGAVAYVTRPKGA